MCVQSMRRPDRKTPILDGRKDWLMAPELVKEFIAEFPPRGEPAQPQPGADLGLQRRELEEVNRKLRGLIEAIAEGPHAPGLQAKHDELEQGKTPTIKSPDPGRLFLRRIGVR